MRVVRIVVLLLAGHFFLGVSGAQATTCAQIWTMTKEDTPKNALEICRQEATRGDRFAQEHVAAAYKHGNLLPGASRDFSEALKWARLAEAQGSTEVFDILANAYHDGNGTPIDLIEAIKFQILKVEHSNKRYRNEDSLFGKKETEQPVGRLILMYDIRTLAKWLNDASSDVTVEAFTRADRWDERNGFKEIECVLGEFSCAPRKVHSK